jgi:ATP-binding cassette, subfamily B, bacterial
MDKATRRYSSLIITYVGRQPLQVAFLAIALLGGIVSQLLNPQILRYFIDTATARGPLENLSRAALLFIGVALVQQILAVLAAYFGQSVGWTATNLLRADLLAHCIKLDISFHKQHTSGEMVERIDGDVNELSNFLSSFAIKILGNLLLLAGVLVLLFLEDWRIGLTMSAFSVLVVVALRRVSAIVQPLVAEHRQVAADFYGFIEEHISSTEDIRSSGASNYSLGRFYTFLQHWLPVRRRADLSSYGTWIASISIFAFGTMVALGLGAYLWSQKLITIGSVYMIFYYTGLLRSPLEEIRTQFQDLQRALASTDRVYNLLHTSSQVQDGPGATCRMLCCSRAPNNLKYHQSWWAGVALIERCRWSLALRISGTASAFLRLSIRCALGTSIS